MFTDLQKPALNDIWGTIGSAVDKITDKTAGSLDKASGAAENINKTANDLITEIKNAKPAFIFIGVTLIALMISSTIKNSLEIKKMW